MRIRVLRRSRTPSTTEEMTERDLDITAATILMMRRIFNEEKTTINEENTKKENGTDNIGD